MGKYKRGILKVLIFTLLISMLPYNAQAITIKDSSINFKSLTIEDGLSQSSVNYMYQDSYGYIWIGTSDGLNKYNGQTFTTYKVDNKNPSSISSNYISAIVEDKEGNLWIGTTNGMNKYNRKLDEFEVYKPINSDISDYNITEIMFDENDNMWVSTVNGVNLYNKETDTFINIFEDRKEEEKTFVYSMQIDKNGLLWLGSKDGIEIYDKKVNSLINVSEKIQKTLSGKTILKLVYDEEKNEMWVGTSGDGLYKIDINENDIERIGENDISGDINYILKCSYGYVWIASSNGLVKYNEEKNIFIEYKSVVYDSQSIVSDNTLSLLQDKNGLLWVGTMDGISKFNPESFFRNYKHDPFDPNSLSQKMISGIYEDDEGILWVNTNKDQINAIDIKKGTVTVYDSTNSNIPSTELWSIDGVGNHIFFATSKGLVYLDKTKGDFINLKPNGSDKDTNDIRKIYIDNENQIWVGTRNGLFTLNKDGTFKDYSSILRSNGAEELFISAIHQDKENKDIMWIGSSIDGGLIKYNKSTNQVDLYKNIENESNSLSVNSIKSIDEDNDGNLWIGTNYGLNKLDKSTDYFESYTERDGLVNNFVYAALVDSNNNIWCSTNGGISMFDSEEKIFKSFTTADGLGSNEFNGYSYYKSESGRLYFGSTNGVVSFMPSEYKTERNISNVVIDSFNTRESKLIDIDDKITLNHKNNMFNVKFFIPDYKNSKGMSYAYMLDGFDTNWIYSDNIGEANYTNIPSGDYKLMMKGRNSSGEWSEISAIKINIANSPWMTPVAYWAYIMLIGIVIYIWVNKVKILEQMVRQRTEELNLKLKENNILYDKLIKHERYKNNYFVNLSHELKTPLNVILSTQQLISRLNESNEPIKKEKLNEYMDGLKGNSNRLLNLINNIIDTSKIESGSFKVNKIEHDIVYVVEELALSMNSLAEEKGIELIIDPEIEEKIVKFDKYHIERCIINLIGNAVKFTNRGGTIIVKIYDCDKEVKVSIKDNGIGIDKKYHKAIFDRFGQVFNQASEEHGGSGLGLTLTSQIISLHDGSIEVISELDEGAEFIITLPV